MTLPTRTIRLASATLVGGALLLQGTSALAEERKLDPAKDKAYEHVIKPILAATCISCHGEKKDKGKIRLHTPEAIKDAEVVVAGNIEDSEMSYRIMLPADDDDVMPPEGKTQLTEDQKKLINWWIEKGADYEKPVAEIEASDEIKKILADWKVGPDKAKDAPKIDLPPAAPQAAIDAISKSGVLIMQLAQNNTFLTANTINVAKTFNDEGLKPLTGVAPQLAWLDVSKTQITDAGLAEIGKLGNLTRLHLEKTGVTDAGMPHLAKLSKLEYLNLYGTKVTDAGVAELKGLKNLKKLFVWQTGVTDKGAADLKSAIPGIDINMGWKEPEKKPEQAEAEGEKKDQGT